MSNGEGGNVELNDVEAKLANAYVEGDSKELERMISELPDTTEPRPLPSHTWFLQYNNQEDRSYCYLCRHLGPGDAKFQCNEERTKLENLVNLAGTVDMEELCITIQRQYNETIREITGEEWTIPSIRRHIRQHGFRPRVIVTEHINTNMNLLEQWYQRSLDYNPVTQEQRVSIEAEEHILKLQKHIEAEIKFLHSMTK